MKDAIKEKLTPHPMPETRAEKDPLSYTGEGVATGGRRLGVDEEGVPVVVRVDVGTTPGGAAASRLREADQISGQTFNDVGPLDGEETTAHVRVDRTRRT